MTDAAPALDGLPATRRAILVHLKKHGEARAEDLAAVLGITVSAVRQHLGALRGDGLVAHRAQRSGPGRPRHLFRLGTAGENLFPRAYGELTTELLGYVEDEDPAMVARVFERRQARRIAAARARLSRLDLSGQVVELARILDEDGYLADSEALPDGTFRIVEHNCAIFAVALKYGQACTSELEFIRAVLPDATVQRVAHMVAGAHQCAYEVRPAAKTAEVR